MAEDPIFLLLQDLLAQRPETAGLLVGLVGRGIAASRSPAMHEREAARLGLACTYLLLDFDRLGLPDNALAPLIRAARRAGFRGLNVTHPFKQDVVQMLDAQAPEVRAIGAANTILFSAAGAVGHNTDSGGFATGFRNGMKGTAPAAVAQFGAGGAGAAVAHALLELGTRELLLVDTEQRRAERLAARLAQTGAAVRAADAATALAAAEGIVNATPVGMAQYPGLPFPQHLLEPRHWVAEIVYFPAETELLRLARQLGCRTLAGKGMAIGQAAHAFKLFTGIRPDPIAMAAHFAAGA